MKEYKGEKGITLIALVITIVVLLILAGVSASYILGNNGIINKLKEAKSETYIEEAKEEISLAINDKAMVYGINDKNLTLEELINPTLVETEKSLEESLRIKDENCSVELNEDDYFLDIKYKGLYFKIDYKFNINNTGENVNNYTSIEETVDPHFYVIDSSGNKLSGYESLFDKNLSTAAKYFNGEIIVKWDENLNISGKQILVKTYGTNGNENFAMQYIDNEKNIISAYTTDYVKTNYINVKSDESITYVPENAVRNKSLFNNE